MTATGVVSPADRPQIEKGQAMIEVGLIDSDLAAKLSMHRWSRGAEITPCRGVATERKAAEIYPG
jgi:hypothetical protein